MGQYGTSAPISHIRVTDPPTVTEWTLPGPVLHSRIGVLVRQPARDSVSAYQSEQAADATGGGVGSGCDGVPCRTAADFSSVGPPVPRWEYSVPYKYDLKLHAT